MIEENLPVKVISTDEIVNYIDQLIRYKVVYEDLKRSAASSASAASNRHRHKHRNREYSPAGSFPTEESPELDPQQQEELFNALALTDWHFDNLYTLIMFDDISGSPLFANEKSYFCSLLRRVRQPKFTIFLLIQNWKGLNPSVKNEITTIFMFKGFNQQQLQHIYSQSSVLERENFIELANSLSKISGFCCIKIDTETGEMELLRL
jgi:hypothetical protein